MVVVDAVALAVVQIVCISVARRNPSFSIYYFLADRTCGVGLARQSFPCIPLSSSYFLVRALGHITSSVSLLLTRNRTTSEMKS